jgi:CheY-like chemotaxis protein
MKGKVLVIEDNAQNLYLVRFILEHDDYEVRTAIDGESGIELAAVYKPDIILLDIQLPVMDGYAVAGALRKNPELSNIPLSRSHPTRCQATRKKRSQPAVTVIWRSRSIRILLWKKSSNICRRGNKAGIMSVRILIADDNKTNLYMFESLLKGYGMDTTIAENGKDALDKARRNPPDIIVSDILMPVMDGFALCREWKTDVALKRIPFVFFTATYSEPGDEAFALNLGADRFIIKPKEPEELMAILNAVLTEYAGPANIPSERKFVESELTRQHNERLFVKLEKKMQDLENLNLELRILVTAL